MYDKVKVLKILRVDPDCGSMKKKLKWAKMGTQVLKYEKTKRSILLFSTDKNKQKNRTWTLWSSW